MRFANSRPTGDGTFTGVAGCRTGEFPTRMREGLGVGYKSSIDQFMGRLVPIVSHAGPAHLVSHEVLLCFGARSIGVEHGLIGT